MVDYHPLHCRYLSALVSQSFLDIGSVSRILDSIMKLCLQFCWSIEQYDTRPNISEIDHITEVYQPFFLYKCGSERTAYHDQKSEVSTHSLNFY
jgi:hypothetical protein